MNDSGIKFRPVMGTEDFIRNAEQSNGWFYVATDTGAMYLDVENRRIQVGGQGGSGGGTAGFVWANGNDTQIMKLVEDDEDYTYSVALAAIEGGVAPKPDQLILNSDGRFFRVIRIDTEAVAAICTLIAVSGSGGGGGGTVVEEDLKVAVDSSTLARNFTLVSGKDYYVSVTATSTVDEYVSLYFTFTGANNYTYNKTVTAKSGEPYLLNVNFLPPNDSITMKVEADSDNTKMKRLPVRTVSGVKVVEMRIQKVSTFNTATAATGSVAVEYYLIGDPAMDETLHVAVDDIEDFELQKSDRVSSSVKSVSVPKQVHGTHNVTLWVTTTIQETTVESNRITYEIAWVDPEDLTPIIWTGEYPDTVIQYEPFTVKYQVYDPTAVAANDYFTVYIQKSGVRIAEISRKYEAGQWLTLDLTESYEVGDNNYTIVCGTAQPKGINFNVTTVGSRDLGIAQSERLIMNLSSTGRSSDEIAANRETWADGAYKATLNGFNWYNNGWKNDDDGNGAYLSIANGATVTIPFRNFATNPIEDFQFNGVNKNYTLEVRFRIRNVQEYSTLVTTNPYYYVMENGIKSEHGVPIADIKAQNLTVAVDEDGNWLMDQQLTEKITKTEEGVCFKVLNNNNYGLCVGTQEAYFRSPEGTTNVRYKEDEVINFSVVVSNADKLASIYLNGILSGSLNLGNDSAFYCGDTITINSNYCDVDIYKIRFFNTGLTMPEVIHNYISDIHDLTLYDQNQLTKEDPTLLSYTKLVEYNKAMLEEGNIDALSMPYAVIEIIDNATGMVNPNGGSHAQTDDLLPWKKGNNRYCKITFVNPVLDALYNAGEIDADTYETHSPSYVCIGADINVQGTSSQGYPRRNYKTKMKSAVNAKDVNKVAHDDWGWFYTNEKFINEAKGGKAKFKKWKQDNPNYGTNKFTWKIDYMESSGSYNTGFANLVGNNIYSTHPLGYYHIPDLDTTGLRSSVYGFPCLTFHKHSKPSDNAKVGTLLEDEIYEYIGRYNINQDKGSDELFGFSLEDEQPYVTLEREVTDPDTGVTTTESYHPTIADVAECWEMTDNQGSWTSFSYPAEAQTSHFSTYTSDGDGKLEVIRHYECRYHKDLDFIEVIASDEAPYDLATVTAKINDPEVKEDERAIWESINTIPKMNQFIVNKWSNWERFVTWCDSTDRRKANPELDITPIEYEVDEFPTDMTGVTTRTNGDIKYATFTKDTAAYRLQKFKSEFNKHLNLEYCTVYFVMTELLLCYDSRGKNMMMASYGPIEAGGDYIWFPIFYDIDTQLGLNNIGATLWDYDTDATLEQAFSTPSSVLWVNFLDCFKDEIANKYRNLRSDSKLTYETIDGAYLCNAAVFDSYAMRGIRPIIAIGLDEYYKYVAPSKTGYYNTSGALVYDNNSYAYAVNGDRMLSRELLLRNRLNYMDSYWIAGDYTPAGMAQGGVRMRANANNQSTSDKYLDSARLSELPSNAWSGEELAPYPMPYYDATPNFEVTPFLSQYVFSYNDKQPSSKPVKYQGQPVSVIAEGVEDGYRATPGMPEQIVYLPAEDYISSLGDLSTKYLSQFTLANGKRILDITIGSDAPDYFNSLLGAGTGQFNINDSKYLSTGNQALNPSRKTLLKKINLTNVKSLQDALDISGSEKLVECRVLGTKIPYVTFAEGAPLDCIHLPWTVTKIDLVEATNLTRILTTKPTVWQNTRDNYTGLYIEDLTDSLEDGGPILYHTDEQGNRLPNKINRINIVGGKLGYDSYRLLDKAVKIKDFENADGQRLQINLEDVEWSPYVMVEAGTLYDANETYYKLTDHSTFVSYTPDFSDPNAWNTDTLNGLIFTYNANPQQTLITSTELLDKFIADYNRANATAEKRSHYTNLTQSLGYPYLTGSIYIANADSQYAAIEEEDITEKYGAIWKKLNIYAAKVNEAYVAKFMHRTENGQDKQIDIKRYKQQSNVHPEITSVLPNYPNYDFKGWSLDPAHSIVEQADYDRLVSEGKIYAKGTTANDLTFSAESDIYVFYAVFVPHPYSITFDIGNNQTVTVQTPFNHTINLPAAMPYQDESELPLEEKYAFLGYAKTATATKPIDMSKEKALRDTKYYAVFKRSSVYANPIPNEYIIFTGPSEITVGVNTDGTSKSAYGYTIGLNPNYSYQGKITLPSYYNNYPVLAIAAGSNDQSSAPNGFSYNNGGRNTATHVFFDREAGEPALARIESYAFFNNTTLQYVEMPETLDYIGNFAFSGAITKLEELPVRSIGEGCFNSWVGQNETMHIAGKVSTILSTPWCYMRGSGLRHLIFGGPGDPVQLKSLPSTALFIETNIEDVTIYVADQGTAIKDHVCWTLGNPPQYSWVDA